MTSFTYSTEKQKHQPERHKRHSLCQIKIATIVSYVELKRGDLIRWVVDHEIYEASGDVLVGICPNYRHGIIMEVSHQDPNAIMVYCYDCKTRKENNWMILNREYDKLEVLSGKTNG